jgi:hypothetical protein
LQPRPHAYRTVDLRGANTEAALSWSEHGRGDPRLWQGKRVALQAVLSDPASCPWPGQWEGDLISTVVRLHDGIPSARLELRQSVQLPSGRTFRLRSPSLSIARKTEVSHRAVQIGGPGLTRGVDTLIYVLPGFQSTWLHAERYRELLGTLPENAIAVLVDATCPWGHHVFVDSASNGPCGSAFVNEFLPFVEEQLFGRLRPQRRVLFGFSSGGWSALWLQQQHSQLFHGAWAIAPDPVDFHAFQTINLYEEETNLYRHADGRVRAMAKGDAGDTTYRDVVDFENFLGSGGQLDSFEAAFGRAGQSRPARLFDRATGRTNPKEAAHWSDFDIAARLNALTKEKVERAVARMHLHVGALDEFYLHFAVERLAVALRERSVKPDFHVHEGKGHFSVWTEALRNRLVREMCAVP